MKIGEDPLLVYISGGSMYSNYINWLPRATRVTDIRNADLVLFAGGEDVSPAIYDEPMGKYTSVNTDRDFSEMQDFEVALAKKKPMLGICRGAQFICAMAGGRLVQHQVNPGPWHPMITREGDELTITSSHHQAQYPYDMEPDEYKVIAWTEDASPMHWNGKNEEISDKPFREVEIAYYPKYNGLGIQGHPEWMVERKDNEDVAASLEYLTELVNKLLNQTL